jgi:hypothetical protein
MATKPSLAASGGALTQGFQLPDVFQPPEPMKPRFIPPYISFVHSNKKDEYAKIVAKFGIIPEGTMVLIRQEGMLQLNTAKLGWLNHRQFWCMKDASGAVTSVSFREMPDPWDEAVEAVVLVYLDDGIVPANIQFRTTKCPAALAMSQALVEASTSAWAEKSPAHKETLVIQQPFLRFYGEVRLGERRTGRGSGQTYVPTQCTVHPTGPGEWRLADAFSKDPESQKKLKDAGDRYQSQLSFFQSKEVK